MSMYLKDLERRLEGYQNHRYSCKISDGMKKIKKKGKFENSYTKTIRTTPPMSCSRSLETWVMIQQIDLVHFQPLNTTPESQCPFQGPSVADIPGLLHHVIFLHH